MITYDTMVSVGEQNARKRLFHKAKPHTNDNPSPISRQNFNVRQVKLLANATLTTQQADRLGNLLILSSSRLEQGKKIYSLSMYHRLNCKPIGILSGYDLIYERQGIDLLPD